MRSTRYFLPAGSAVAAAVVLVVLFATPTQRSVVSASTIMTSFRETLHQGMRFTMENISHEDVLIDGRMSVLFAEPFNLAQLIEEASNDLEPAGIYCDLTIRLGPEAEELAGLDMRAAMAMTEQEQWVYAQFNNLDPLIEKAGPAVLMFGPVLRGGILLELEGMFDEGGPFGVAHDSVVHATLAGQHGEKMEVLAESHAEIAYDPETSHVSVGIGADLDDVEGFDEEQLKQTLMRFLSGEAAPEEFEALIAAHEELEGRADVEEVEPGLHVLTIREFDEIAGDDEFLADARVQVAYREGVGIEWARIENIGDLHGSIEMEFIDALDEGDRLSREQFIEEGVTTVLNLGELIGSMEALSNAFGAGEDDEQPEDESAGEQATDE